MASGRTRSISAFHSALTALLIGAVIAVAAPSVANAADVDTPPVAGFDQYNTYWDKTLTVDAAHGLLANDSDVDANETLTATVVTGVQHGVLTLKPDGSFLYVPDASGASEFLEYSVSDGTNTVTQVLLISVSEYELVDGDDQYTAYEGQPLTVPASQGVLANDTSALAGAALVATILSQPANSEVHLAANGSFTYTPDLVAGDQPLAVSFEYRVSDGRVKKTATVTIDILPYALPVAVDDSFDMAEDGAPLTAHLLANDSGASPVANNEIRAPGTVGTLVPTAVNGDFTYTPAPDFFGTETFFYTFVDALGDSSNEASVTFNVGAVNDAPLAVPDAFATGEDTPFLVDVVGNDTDADGDAITAAIVTPPTHGTLVPTSAGNFVYTPALDYSGADSFTYTAVDPAGATTTPTPVTITVLQVNDAPVGHADAFTGGEGTDITGEVLTNDTDVDSETLYVESFTAAAHGELVVGDDGTFTYTPEAGFSGVDTFTYTVTDTAATPMGATLAASDPTTVTLTITAVVPASATGGRLASTGSDMSGLLPVAFWLVLFGAALLLARRRRQAEFIQ